MNNFIKHNGKTFIPNKKSSGEIVSKDGNSIKSEMKSFEDVRAEHLKHQKNYELNVLHKNKNVMKY